MTQRTYFRPLVNSDRMRPKGALSLAGGALWFSHVVRIRRDIEPVVIPAREVPEPWLSALTSPRAPLMGFDFTRPCLMGILNVTPDSFSDGGLFNAPENAVKQAREMISQGADLVDIGGESTRPGAKTIDPKEEISRVAPVIRALRAKGVAAPISIDTRKSTVARAALKAGGSMVNDVSALSYDPEMIDVLRHADTPICLMHALGDPSVMQDDPTYRDVLLDVYDALNARIDLCEEMGISRHRIIIDPGIGFGKSVQHNLALMRGLSLFHGLGCAILLGVSRKSIIGLIANEPDPNRRVSGSLALALEGLRQGVQMLRVHDIRETRQAIDLWQATR